MTELSPGFSVVIVSRTPPDSPGPAWERIRHLASASAKIFGETVVLTLQGAGSPVDGKELKSREFLQAVRLVREAPFPINGFFDPLKFVLLSIHGLLLSWRCKPRFVLASVPPFEVGVSACVVARFRGVDLVVDLRDDWESSVEERLSRYFPRSLLNLLFWVAGKVYSSATVVLVATETIGKSVEGRGVKTPVRVVPNGADTSIFVPRDEEARRRLRVKYAFPQDKVVMLYCGSGVNPYYRLDRVQAAVNSLPDDVKEHLLFVYYLYNGIEQVRELKAKLGVSDELIEVREPVSRFVLAEVMAACDVGVVPFDDEPYLLCARSAKLYEYLSAGLFVVGSGPRDGELAELFSAHPELGRFSLPYVDGFVDVFSSLVRGKRSFLGENNRFLRHKFIQENHERRAIMVKAMNEIRSLLDRRK